MTDEHDDDRRAVEDADRRAAEPSLEPGAVHPPDVVPGDRPQPTNQPIDDEVVSEPLEDEEGRTYRIAQENVGAGEEEIGRAHV